LLLFFLGVFFGWLSDHQPQKQSQIQSAEHRRLIGLKLGVLDGESQHPAI